MKESCPSCQMPIKKKEVKIMKPQAAAVGVIANPSYGYFGWTMNVYLTFSSLDYAATPTIDYVTFSPHDIVGGTNLTTNSVQVVDTSPLTLLVNITIPTTALTRPYDLAVGVDGADMTASSVFVVYASPDVPDVPSGIASTISAIMPIFILMMLMMMMRGMFKK